jgi:hypothetical protein
MKTFLLTIAATLGLFSSVFAEHEHHAPHNGTLVVLGEEFAHVELVLDAQTGALSAYSLDGEAENAVPIVQNTIDLEITPKDMPAFDLKLAAVENPLTGETIGNTSEFRGQAEELRGLSKFAGVVLNIETRGQEFKNVAFDFPEGNERD